MTVDQFLEVDVGGLILGVLVLLEAQLRHAVVGAEGQALAFDINPLAAGELAVEGGLADLDVDAAGGVLDIELAVDIAFAVVGDDLALDPDVAELDTAGLVHFLQGLDGRKLTVEARERRLGIGNKGVRLVVTESEDGLPFFFQTLAGDEGGEGRKSNQ